MRRAFLAPLHEVQKSYFSHLGRTRSCSHSCSRHTLLKFSRSPYLDKYLSESIHTWTNPGRFARVSFRRVVSPWVVSPLF